MGFTLFGIEIKLYGVMIALGLVAAFIVCYILAKKKKMHADFIFDVALIVVPLGILGARLYFIIFNGSPISDFFNFRDGGLAIYGGVIGGVIGILIYCYIKKINFFKVADIIVVGLILAQSIGRWGNFFNQEVYGVAITNPSFQFFPLGVYIDGSGWHVATFFIESILNLAGFFILLTVMNKNSKTGITSALYLLIYGVVRLGLEFIRLDNLMLGNTNIQISLLVSIICIIISVVFIVLINKNKLIKSEENLASEDK